MSELILEVDNLGVSFHTHEGVVQAVNGLSYSLRRGETLGIVGESGSGKSVSSMAVMDLLPKPPSVISPESSIKISGREVIGLSKRETRAYRGNVVSMIFQDPMTCLNPYIRIDKQMIEGMIYHKGVSKKEALKKAQSMLEYVHVPDAMTRLKSYPHELSGGMRQRVMIAMALMNDPRLIFADEPTTALDVTVQAQIMKLLKQLQEKFETGIVMISHDLGVIATQSQKVLVMYAGQVMEYSAPDKLFESPQHPYTVALKKSIPDLHPKEGEADRLEAIDGLPPNLMQLGSGCPFAPRCKVAVEGCLAGQIPIKEVSKGHWVRCIL